jgi:hypothetical protein
MLGTDELFEPKNRSFAVTDPLKKKLQMTWYKENSQTRLIEGSKVL